MKGLILVLSCLLLFLLIPMNGLVGDGCTGDSALSCLTEGEKVMGDGDDMQTDILYNDDVLTLLTTYDCQNDDVVPCRLNRLARQLRVMSSRVQMRCHRYSLMVKKLTTLLSVYFSTLINHIIQSYSTLKLVCWQYSSDCYVFAFRQILI